MTVNVKEENWVGTKEAAEFLGVKPATIRDWIRKGKDIPRMKIGKAWLNFKAQFSCFIP